MKISNRKGQFYLIAAIIIVSIIVGIIAVTNYIIGSSSTRIYDLKEELEIESSNVLDYITYNQLSQIGSNQLFQDFVQEYINYWDSDKSLYFVFGNQNNVTVKGYQQSARVVSIASGTSQETITESVGEFIGGIIPNSNEVTLNIDDNSYNFELNKGENFYFVIFQEAGEKSIISG